MKARKLWYPTASPTVASFRIWRGSGAGVTQYLAVNPIRRLQGIAPGNCTFCSSGGERGIRTLDTPCGRIRAFQARSFSHSDISPLMPPAPTLDPESVQWNRGLIPMARPARLERAAFGPAIRRSIQLSYGRYGSKLGLNSYSAAT